MAEQQFAKTNSGFVTLTSVIILGAIGAIIATTLLTLGISSTQNSQIDEYSAAARGFANACSEISLLNIKNNGLLAESGTLNFTTGSCEYNTILNSDETVQISSIGNVKDIVRKIKIIISTTSPNIIVDSWQEVTNL